MSDDLSDLYQDVILDHSRHPRNRREMQDADRKAQGYNPLCGDEVTVYLKIAGDELKDVSFTGRGCAICTATASIMTETTRGKSTATALAMFERFHDLLTHAETEPSEELGELAALTGVRRFPMRVKCATLPWHTLRSALASDSKPVTTE